MPTPLPPALAGIDPYYVRLVFAASVDQVAQLMEERFREQLGHPVKVDLTGGDLFFSKFVAAAADQWGRHNGEDELLERLSYAPLDPMSRGETTRDGRHVMLNVAHFGAQPTRPLIEKVTDLALGHLIDDVPEHVAALVTLHELSHVEASGLTSRYSHDFLPNLTAEDAYTEAALLSALTGQVVVAAQLLARTRGISPWPLAAKELAKIRSQRDVRDALLTSVPGLRSLTNRASLYLHIGPNAALKGKEEAFPDAKTQLYIAGPQAGQGTRLLADFGRSTAAITADAEPFRSRLEFLRVNLDPSGFRASDPRARQSEVLSGRASLANVTVVMQSTIRASAPLEPDAATSYDGAALPPDPLKAAETMVTGAVIAELAKSVGTILESPHAGVRPEQTSSPARTAAVVRAGLVPPSPTRHSAPTGSAVTRKPDSARSGVPRIAHAAAVARDAGMRQNLPPGPRYTAQAAGLSAAPSRNAPTRVANRGAIAHAQPAPATFRSAASARGVALEINR